MEFIHFDHFHPGRRAQSVNRFPQGLDPGVDRHMTAMKQAANGTEPESLQVQLQGLAFQSRAFATVSDGMAIRAPMTQVPLLAFHDPIFDAGTGFTVWAGNHRRASCWGKKKA
jgi:hypothetical protein